MNRKWIVIALLSVNLLCPSAYAAGGSETASEASAALSLVTASMVVEGAPYIPKAGEWLVEGVSHVGGDLVLGLKNVSARASDAASATLKVSETAVGKASVGVGQSVQITATAAGMAVSLAGAVIAYIPNELGQSLVHHSKM